MTHEVVSRLLLGAVEVAKGDAQGVRAHHAVGAAGQTHPVQCPVQRAGLEAELRAQRARGCQTGADTQDGILRGDHCYIWMVDTHTQTLFKAELVLKKTTFSSDAPLLFLMSRFHLILIVKTAQHKFPQSKVMTSNYLFCPSKCPKSKDINFTKLSNLEKLQILIFQKQMCFFCLMNGLND